MKRACLFGKASEWVGPPGEDLIPRGTAFVRLMLPASAWVVIWDTGSAAMAAGIVTAVVTVGRSIAVILKALNAMMKARKNAAIYTTDAPPKLRRFRSLHHCASMLVRHPFLRAENCIIARWVRGNNGANSLAKTALRAGCSRLARRLSGPSLACVRECAYLTKAEQPGNLRYM